MGAKTSNAMLRALRLIERGATVHEAARKTGLWTQSIYQAQTKKRKIAAENSVNNQIHDNYGIDRGQEIAK